MIRGSIVDMSRRLLLLAYLIGVHWCIPGTHYILALLCHFYAPKQFCMLSGYSGTRVPGYRVPTCTTRVLVPEETDTRPRVRVIDLKKSGTRLKRVPDGVQLYWYTRYKGP